MDRLDALYRQYLKFAPLVREIADIGADHGYLSKRILESGFYGRIIVTDIAAMPLEVARKNIGNRPDVIYRQCNGLSGDFSSTDLVFIAGMGGDLIANIIAEAADIKNDVIYVLQPMTNFQKTLCRIESRYLYSYFANEKEKHYRMMIASSSPYAAVQNKEAIRIPWLFDMEEFDSEEDCRCTTRGEAVLKENLGDAVIFFQHKLEQAEKITKSVKQIPVLYERAKKRENLAREILVLLNAQLS
ncbi:MAG: tRNA (adenine(22)-N(1))-methyltransferase TrmK [Bacillota bacterium]|nr:tRNA (adenine(22)-N(1))-methyltransferase TrmK [Bacillota bacterium]